MIYTVLQKKRKLTQVFESCISFGEDCKPVDLESYKISMTLCQGQWPRGTKKNEQIKFAFLFEKSAVITKGILMFWTTLHWILVY